MKREAREDTVRETGKIPIFRGKNVPCCACQDLTQPCQDEQPDKCNKALDGNQDRFNDSFCLPCPKHKVQKLVSPS